MREPLPDEPWVSVWERPGYNPLLAKAVPVPGEPKEREGANISGKVPSVDANFAEMVLDQLGIPHAWDPFPPEQSADPYGLSRPFLLLVPESMAAEAQRCLTEASEAPFDWNDMPR